MGLVHLCARRFDRGGVDYEDLFQAGCVGLILAAQRYDPDRGTKFSTYAVPVILGEIRRLFREGGSLRVSRGTRELSRRVRQAEDDLRRETGRAPGLGEVAQRLGVPPERVALALGAAQGTVSLSGEGEEAVDVPVAPPEEELTERMTLQALLAALEERDRALLRYRYFQGKTQAETGRLLGMTQVQVSRREKKLLLALRGGFE